MREEGKGTDETVRVTVELPAALAEWIADWAARNNATLEHQTMVLLYEAAWEHAENRLRSRLSADVAPAVARMANALMSQAIDSGAEELHLVPGEDAVRVFHADCHGSGACEVGAPPYPNIPLHIKEPLFARFEKMADARLYSERAPREERIPVLHKGRSLDIFVRYAPDERSASGESMVLRIVRKPAPAV